MGIASIFVVVVVFVTIGVILDNSVVLNEGLMRQSKEGKNQSLLAPAMLVYVL